jgi:hypothetical protein
VVVDALAADRDPRVVPMLARIVGESELLGKDHEIVLETLGAMARSAATRRSRPWERPSIRWIRSGPRVKIISNALGEMIEQPAPVNTWERDNRGEHVRAVVEAVHPEPLGIDPLQYL